MFDIEHQPVPNGSKLYSEPFVLNERFTYRQIDVVLYHPKKEVKEIYGTMSNHGKN